MPIKEQCRIQDQMTAEPNHILLMYKIRLYNQFDLVNILAVFETYQLFNCTFFTAWTLLTMAFGWPPTPNNSDHHQTFIFETLGSQPKPFALYWAI